MIFKCGFFFKSDLHICMVRKCFKTWKNDNIFHIIDQIQVLRCPLKSEIAIFPGRFTRNYAYSPFKVSLKSKKAQNNFIYAFSYEDNSNNEEAAVLLTTTRNYLVTIRNTIHTFQNFSFCFYFNVDTCSVSSKQLR